MDILAFITAVIAVLVAAGFAVAWARGRRSEPEVPPEAVIDRAVEAVDRAFAARLQTGQAELEHQRVSFDRKWDGVTARVNEELSGIKSAVIDALSHLGISHLDMPCTPEKVWRAISEAAAESRSRPA